MNADGGGSAFLLVPGGTDARKRRAARQEGADDLQDHQQARQHRVAGMRCLAAAAGRLNIQLPDPEEAHQRPLMDADVLDVLIGDRHLMDRPESEASPQRSIPQRVPHRAEPQPCEQRQQRPGEQDHNPAVCRLAGDEHPDGGQRRHESDGQCGQDRLPAQVVQIRGRRQKDVDRAEAGQLGWLFGHAEPPHQDSPGPSLQRRAAARWCTRGHVLRLSLFGPSEAPRARRAQIG